MLLLPPVAVVASAGVAAQVPVMPIAVVLAVTMILLALSGVHGLLPGQRLIGSDPPFD